MSLRIYNTMSREKEAFTSHEPGKVKMYVCGPTVYDYIHIGNARPAIFFDVVRRYLESIGYDVNYVVNFTDVDDKLIRKAEQLGTTVPEVAERFIAAFNENIEGLGIRQSDDESAGYGEYPANYRVYRGLVDKGAMLMRATETCIFRTAYIPGLRQAVASEYGGAAAWHSDRGRRAQGEIRRISCCGRARSRERSSGRAHGDRDAQAGISNARPWREGIFGRYAGYSRRRHTICNSRITSAKSPSPNRSRASRWHDYWMHNGFININNEKMSKSLGNGITVQEMLKRIKPEAIRYFMLSAHYRSSP